MNDYLERILAVLGEDMWLLAGLAIALVCVVAWMLSLGRGGRAASTAQAERDNSSVWATAKDVRDMIVDPKRSDPRRMVIGTLNGKQLAGGPHWSLLVIAPTRMGKTARVVVPTVLRHRGPAVVASVKGDVRALTEHHRGQRGPVWVFDPTRSDSARWSPLAGVRTWADALNAATWVQQSSKADDRGLEGQRFWDTNARRLLAPVMLLTALGGGTMADVFTRIANLTAVEQTQIAEDLIRRDADAADYWAAFCSLEHRTRANVLATANDVLEAWVHPDVARVVNATANDDVLNVADLLDQNGTLYLVAPAGAQAQFTAVYETLTNAVLREVEVRHARTDLPLDPPLLLMLDEAANIAPLRHLDKVASSMAGQGVNVVTVWQSIAQLRAIYGHDRADTVLDNHSTKLYLGGISDPRTLDEVSRAIGRDVVARESGDHRTHHDIDVAPAASIRQQQAGDAIAISGNHKPARIQIDAWYEDKAMRRLIDARVAAASDAQYAPTSRRRKVSVR